MLLNSQTCENEFRTYRSMSTTRSTVTDFDIKEMCQKAKRLYALKEISSSVEDFEFHQTKSKNKHIPTALLSDDEVNNILHSAFEDAKFEFSELSKF